MKFKQREKLKSWWCTNESHCSLLLVLEEPVFVNSCLSNCKCCLRQVDWLLWLYSYLVLYLDDQIVLSFNMGKAFQRTKCCVSNERHQGKTATGKYLQI